MLTWCKFPMHKDGVTFTHPSNLRKLLAIVISSCVHGKLYHADKMSTVLVNGARGEQSAGLHKSMQMTSCEIIMLEKNNRMPLCCLPLLDWRRWKEAFFISLFFSVSLSLSLVCLSPQVAFSPQCFVLCSLAFVCCRLKTVLRGLVLF